MDTTMKNDFGELYGSDEDSQMSESVEISELRKRMWKDKILLRKLEGTVTDEAKSEELRADEESSNSCQCSLILLPQPSRKTMLRAEDGVLRYMLKIMRDCKARGFVYGILPNTGPPVTGSSDGLRAWWKDTVAFDRNAPHALLGLDSSTSAPIVQTLGSYLHNLQDMNDNTIGSILSALIQHCVPPQRSFPFEYGMAPPWWPTGDESWWGLQGQSQAQLGPPPYRKPHDLRKGWKLSLLAAVIKHMSPHFEQLRRLVWQSKKLQRKMSGREVETWSKVLNQEEALVAQTKKSLVLEPLDDHDIDGGFILKEDFDIDGDDMAVTRKRKCAFENTKVGSDDKSKEMCLERVESGFGHFNPDVEIDRGSIEELMRWYYNVQEGSSGDLGGLFL